jgi:hypothetical protein
MGRKLSLISWLAIQNLIAQLLYNSWTQKCWFGKMNYLLVIEIKMENNLPILLPKCTDIKHNFCCYHLYVMTIFDTLLPNQKKRGHSRPIFGIWFFVKNKSNHLTIRYAKSLICGELTRANLKSELVSNKLERCAYEHLEPEDQMKQSCLTGVGRDIGEKRKYCGF